MVIIVGGLLLLAVAGYISTPFVANTTRAQFRMSQEQRKTLETAIEREIEALRAQGETMPGRSEE